MQKQSFPSIARHPAMHDLVAFDAAVRHASFTAAAGELGLTQSAVSRQIASLEQHLGARLFERAGRRVSLTDAGQRFHASVAPALCAIQTAAIELRITPQGSGLLRLASVPTFTTHCLIPRLPSFREQHPGITISFAQHLSGASPMPANVDVAVRYGLGQWGSDVAQYVAGRACVVIAPPGYRRSVTGLQRATLLHHIETAEAWATWCVASGTQGLDTRAGIFFNQYSQIIQAVVAGMGLAVVPFCLVQALITEGRLSLAHDAHVKLPYGHYMCFRAEAADHPAVAAFRGWLLAQARVAEWLA